MRLKRILLENEQQKQFKKDCKPFLQKNKEKLRDGFFLKRASSNNYGSFTRKASRQRKEVYSPDLYYFYEKYRPNSSPSRKNLIPTYGNEIATEVFQEDSYNVYNVLPVGNNYKMVYNYQVEDFNYNDLLERHDLKIYIGCANVIALNMGHLFGRLERSEEFELPSKFEGAKKFSYSIECDTDVSRIEKHYPQFFEFLERYPLEELEDIIDMDTSPSHTSSPSLINKKIKRNLKRYKKYFSDYFSSFEVTQQLKNNMSQREVGLYAPDGFYYVPKQKEALVTDVLAEL